MRWTCLAIVMISAIVRELTGAGAAHSAVQMEGTSATSVPAVSNVGDFDRVLALRTFDVAWRRVKQTYFDEDFAGLDWDAVRDELRPKIEEASSNHELQAVIQEMLDRLGQSHFAIVPGDVVDAIEPDEEGVEEVEVEADVEQQHVDGAEPADDRPGHTGIKLYVINDLVVVTRVASGSPAEKHGVRPGWAIIAVRGREVGDFVAHLPDHLDDRNRAMFVWRMLEHRLQGTPGTSVAVTFLDHDDREVVLDLKRIATEGEPTKLGNMPTMYAHLEREMIEREDGGIRVGLIRFNVWMLPMMRSFAVAIDELYGADGIVIDLRGNPGGIGAMAMSVAGYFSENRFSLGTMMNRQTSIEFRAMPQFSLPSGKPFDPYAGPVAILIDEATGSTSEIFAAGMQESGRARVFGATSYGGVLPSVFYRLPNGDVLQHAISDFISAQGTRLEGRGVVPDQPVRMTRQSLLMGRDPVLEAATEWIAAKAAKREAALAE